jgi:hypothetical protein
LTDLEGLAIHATDGDIGKTTDIYFDDKQWTIRYLVVETGPWFSSKMVLLSPMAIKHLDITEKIISATITREQVRHSPDIDTQKPVSRQFEIDYAGFYGYPFYWGGTGLWGAYSSPHVVAVGYESDKPDSFIDDNARKHTEDDRHLRSGNEPIGYHIEAHDGEIGHLQGMLIDTDTLAIRYLIINTSNWWLGNLVLVAPAWIKEVSWLNAKIYVDMGRQQIKDAPTFNGDMPFSRDQEEQMHSHYGRTGYWENEPARERVQMS